MTQNIKTSNKVLITDSAQKAGLIMMTLAATLGMVELPEHSRAVAVAQSSIVIKAAEQQGENPSSSMRREREEAGPHYVSYSVAQRTPGRTGRI